LIGLALGEVVVVAVIFAAVAIAIAIAIAVAIAIGWSVERSTHEPVGWR
jgi:hypothetical protein